MDAWIFGVPHKEVDVFFYTHMLSKNIMQNDKKTGFSLLRNVGEPSKKHSAISIHFSETMTITLVFDEDDLS